MKKFIVYITINTVNRKIYVGVHGTPQPDKFDGYIGNGVYLGSNPDPITPFRRAVIKYGSDKFQRITLGVFDTAEEAYYEESIIVTKDFIDRPDTYNITLGGYHTNCNTKKILQYSMSGKFLKQWDSLTDVLTYFNKKTHSALSKALSGKTESYLKYQWRYFTEDFPRVISPIESNVVDKIYQYSLNGEFINEFNSAYDAAKFCTDVQDRSNTIISNRARIIVRCTQTMNEYANYQWRKFTGSVPLTIEEYIDKRTVLQLDSDLNIVKSWNNKSEAENAGFKNLSRCLNGKNLSAHGYKWAYKKDYKQIRS